MENIKMIITDLDMTALRADKSISEYTRNIFKECKERNIITAIATARSYIAAEKYIRALNSGYAITSDGTMTYQNGEFIFGTGFDAAAANDIIGEIMGIDVKLDLTITTSECVYWNSKNISESPVLYKAVYNDYKSPLQECAYKIVAELPDKSTADYIGARYNCKVISYRGENRYGFISNNAGKIQALRQLAEMLNIPMAKIAAFGDDTNDIEMLTECGYGIAVENAVEEVKKAANFVCGSNDSDGVAKYIEEYFF